ncbi:MAG: phosphate signaling complex protein PhoU [Bdellovibrionales bacterium]|nr:phosphate signaling complex protein PhoU [Bdellovibrionales bacterium]
MRTIEAQLNVIKDQLLSVSTQVEQLFGDAVRAVDTLDAVLARKTIESDHRIDREEVEVEESCLQVLATQQPVANDLRFLVGVLKVNNDLERVGDLGVNIAERALFLSQLPRVDAPFDFREMAEKTRRMLKGCLDSLIQRDIELAKRVLAADDEVDAINREMYARVYKAIEADPARVQSYMQYLSVSRHLERIADYCTNIAEDVIYMVTGKIERHKPEIAVPQQARWT